MTRATFKVVNFRLTAYNEIEDVHATSTEVTLPLDAGGAPIVCSIAPLHSVEWLDEDECYIVTYGGAYTEVGLVPVEQDKVRVITWRCNNCHSDVTDHVDDIDHGPTPDTLCDYCGCYLREAKDGHL